MHTKIHKAVARAAMVSLALATGLVACGEGDARPLIDAAPTDGGDGGDASPQPLLEVSTNVGALRGKLAGTTRKFLGIPYAMPPVAERRFMPPEPAAPWSGVRDATMLGPACPQPPSVVSAPPPYSEDCLTINVYTPAAPGTRRPVMVWFYGGAFITGGSMQYEMARLSDEGGVVIVTFNYRLGALGFLSLPELDAARPGAPSGNDALRDQQLALRWVQENIAAFDGDPDQVTLFGESAGAACACLQMLSPTSQALAKRYILQSGTCMGGLPLSEKAAADAIGLDMAGSLCPDAADKLACLRALDAQQIVQWGARRGITGAGWAPVINAVDPLLPVHPKSLVAEPRLENAELMLGSNRNEWALFAQALGPNPMTLTELDDAIEAALPLHTPAFRAALKEHYVTSATPPITDATASETYIRLMTDLTFRCPARVHARLSAALGRKTYLYSFEHGSASHAYELSFLFGIRNVLVTGDLEPVHAVMSRYWLQFAKTGDPNGGSLPDWPTYAAETDRHMTITATPTEGTGLSRDACDLLAELLGGV